VELAEAGPYHSACLSIVAAGASLAKWGYPCAETGTCTEHCEGGHFMGLDWQTCPVGVARSSWRIQAALLTLRTKQLCGHVDPQSIPSWLLTDMAELDRLIAKAAREG
jgi:hypothetical protein